MDWASVFVGFLAGSLLFDGLWRLTHLFAGKLLERQRDLINEQERLIRTFCAITGTPTPNQDTPNES